MKNTVEEIYLHVSIKILKRYQTQSEGGRDMMGKNEGNNRRGMKRLLNVEPYCRATTGAMMHNILELFIMIKRKSGSRPMECMETITPSRKPL